MCSVEASAPARETIVASALRLFGEHGIEATSLRTVAKAAGISPALVVHHFGGKQGLVQATDAAALERFANSYREPEASEGGDLLRQRSAQTARVMREQPEAGAYLGRALVEGTPGSARLFRIMIEAGQMEIDALARRGAIREDADLLWATLQHFFLIWAPLCFRAVLEKTEPHGSILDPKNLDRWVNANERLLRDGLYR
jgi:AcrR family transcriptional regulator